VAPGDTVVTADTPMGPLGLSVCYDLRFPELYRVHAERGASVLAVPAAFTVPTGRAHWEVLLRARAIENQAFVVAPAQVGEHFPGRRSYGHSLVVGPWGDVLAEGGGEAEGVVLATLDPSALASARRMVPALAHRRLAVTR
jgi:predicted amidohydrolase